MPIRGTVTRAMLIGKVLHPAVTGYVVDNLLGATCPVVLGLTWMQSANVSLDLARMKCHIRAHGTKVTLQLGEDLSDTPPTPLELLHRCQQAVL